MGKYVLIASTRGASIPIETKIKAIAKMKHDGVTAAVVVGQLYEELGRTIPTKPSQVVGAWRQQIQERLDEEDPKVTKICLEEDVVEPGERRRRARIVAKS